MLGTRPQGRSRPHIKESPGAKRRKTKKMKIVLYMENNYRKENLGVREGRKLMAENAEKQEINQ